MNQPLETTRGNLLEALKGAMPQLSRQEAAVASTVLADPEAVLHRSLAVLAARAGVSQPTVIRLCRTVGCEGFADFKLKLAQALVPGTPYVSAHVREGDDPIAFSGKIFDAAAAALHAARTHLDPGAVKAAIDRLVHAHRIVVFGLGGSAPTAADAQHKLSRFPVPCQALSDPLLARMLLAGMGEGDVLLVISNTGRTVLVIELVELARTAGVCVVALTAPGSPLASRADLLIAVSPAEDAELYTPMASRIVHLTLVDVLATGVALAHGAEIQPRLAHIKASLRATRVPSGQD